jgi:site-specific DNA recombinase
MEQKLRKGEWPGKAPFGYKNITLGNGKNDIVVDEYNAIILRQLFELYATGTYSMQLLRKKFTKEYGVKWSNGFIDAVFKNPFYYGFMLSKDSLYQHRYPPLISHALFDQVKKINASFNKKPAKFAGLP